MTPEQSARTDDYVLIWMADTVLAIKGYADENCQRIRRHDRRLEGQ